MCFFARSLKWVVELYHWILFGLTGDIEIKPLLQTLQDVQEMNPKFFVCPENIPNPARGDVHRLGFLDKWEKKCLTSSNHGERKPDVSSSSFHGGDGSQPWAPLAAICWTNGTVRMRLLQQRLGRTRHVLHLQPHKQHNTRLLLCLAQLCSGTSQNSKVQSVRLIHPVCGFSFDF